MTNNSVILGYFSQLFSQQAQFPLLYKYAWKKLESFVFQNSHMENLKYILNPEPKDLSANKSRGT